MPKRKREADSGQQIAFEAAMERIKIVTGKRTQVQLAAVLEVRQSSISDAKRRYSVPDGWLVKLLRSHQVLPDWILTGEGQQYLGGDAHATVAALQEQLRLVLEDFAHLVARVEDSLDTISLTDAELARRKALHAGRLAVDLEKAQGLRTKLENMATDVAALN